MTPLEKFEMEEMKKRLAEEKKNSWKEKVSKLFGSSDKDDAERESEIRKSYDKKSKIRETRNKDYNPETSMIDEANAASEKLREKRRRHEELVNSSNYEDGGIAKKKSKFLKQMEELDKEVPVDLPKIPEVKKEKKERYKKLKSFLKK